MPNRDDVHALAELAEPLRRRVYEFVDGSPAHVSKDDAAQALGIGRSLAAYHLDRLLAAGLLTASYARRTGRSGPGAGRTAKLYAVSGREFEATVPARDYEQMGRLLAAAIERDETGAARSAVEATARDQGRAAGSAAAGSQPVEVLRERGYRPVSGDDGVLRLANCPYDRLAQEHREVVCAVNHAFISGMIEGLGTPGARAELEPRPGMCCVALHVT